MRVLFVSNGHGEATIAGNIAGEVGKIVSAQCDHLAIVGVATDPAMRDVGPRRVMPSGGLVAMGSMRNIARDLGAGLMGLTFAQRKFLRSIRGQYDIVVAVGDAFALIMAFIARAPTVFVGTAKSVHVAPYGPMERRILRKAQMVFVRDAATAQRLRETGIAAESPGNVIVDLFTAAPDLRECEQASEGFDPLVALFPGSRETAYDDAVFLCAVVTALASEPDLRSLGALLSLSPSLDESRFASELQRAGLEVAPSSQPLVPFVVRSNGQDVIRAWKGSIGATIARATVVLGQAGTANEAAAAGGVPVVAFEPASEKKQNWYRKRQAGLLGEALLIAQRDVEPAARSVRDILADGERRAKMAAAGKARMGGPGGARAIAERIAGLAGGLR